MTEGVVYTSRRIRRRGDLAPPADLRQRSASPASRRPLHRRDDLRVARRLFETTKCFVLCRQLERPDESRGVLQLSICFPKNRATVWASLYSTSVPGTLPRGVTKSTQPSTSPSASTGAATDRQ